MPKPTIRLTQLFASGYSCRPHSLPNISVDAQQAMAAPALTPARQADRARLIGTPEPATLPACTDAYVVTGRQSRAQKQRTRSGLGDEYPVQTQTIPRASIHTFPACPACKCHPSPWSCHCPDKAQHRNCAQPTLPPLITPGHVMADNCGHGHRHARHSNAVFAYPSPHLSCRYAAGTDGQDRYHQPCLLSHHHGSPALQCLYLTRSPGEPRCNFSTPPQFPLPSPAVATPGRCLPCASCWQPANPPEPTHLQQCRHMPRHTTHHIGWKPLQLHAPPLRQIAPTPPCWMTTVPHAARMIPTTGPICGRSTKPA